MPMKKFINDAENLTAELLEGFALAYRKQITVDGKTVLRSTPKSQDKVALVTLGGAGHEPALSGFVGEGSLDASVVGDIFAAAAEGILIGNADSRYRACTRKLFRTRNGDEIEAHTRAARRSRRDPGQLVHALPT